MATILTLRPECLPQPLSARPFFRRFSLPSYPFLRTFWYVVIALDLYNEMVEYLPLTSFGLFHPSISLLRFEFHSAEQAYCGTRPFLTHLKSYKNLSLLVKDVAILELVGSFLSLPIINENGRVLNLKLKGSLGEICGIPPAGLLTLVLLNFFLTDLDHEFPLSFPGVNYKRYLDHVYVSCFDEKSLLDEQEVFRLLDRLDLIGNISSIEPGEGVYLPCYGGNILVTRDGYIQAIISDSNDD